MGTGRPNYKWEKGSPFTVVKYTDTLCTKKAVLSQGTIARCRALVQKACT